ncbi:MAG: acetyl-CoA carboxylase biotin carboxyl carrier protein [Candidatus Omnitrophica bacterium]|nr:acetyl-CoA carboxylase biotin carboxyl carrier protein [Candidatus Omnitrophota bacterium]
MDLKKIKEIINLMNEEDLAEIEVEEEGKRIKLRKKEPNILKEVPNFTVQSPVVQNVQEAPKKDDGGIYINAPMIGTFYSAPAPDAEPYINTGQAVKIGDTICIIEAMKLMNEIKSEVKGRVVEVLAENGDPVDYGQPLFKIMPE